MGLVRSGRAGAWTRAIALAMLLVLQSLVPAAAYAHDEGPGGGLIEICTGTGPKLVHAGRGHHHGFAGLACEQCVLLSLAGVAAAPPPLPVRVEAVAFAYAPAAGQRWTIARPAPRPPSRGPPPSA